MHPLALQATAQPTTNAEASAPGGSARTVNTAEATATAAEAAAEAGTFVVAASAGLEASTDNPQDEEKLNAPIALLTVSNTCS